MYMKSKNIFFMQYCKSRYLSITDKNYKRFRSKLNIFGYSFANCTVCVSFFFFFFSFFFFFERGGEWGIVRMFWNSAFASSSAAYDTNVTCFNLLVWNLDKSYLQLQVSRVG